MERIPRAGIDGGENGPSRRNGFQLDKLWMDRRLYFPNAEAVRVAIQAYFDDCEMNDRAPIIGELAVWLGTSTETLIKYGARQRYRKVIVRAVEVCYAAAQRNVTTKGANTLGWISYLNNLYGWKEKSPIEINAPRIDGFRYVIPPRPKEDEVRELTEGKITEVEAVEAKRDGSVAQSPEL